MITGACYATAPCRKEPHRPDFAELLEILAWWWLHRSMTLCPRLHAVQVDQLQLGQLLDQVGDQLLHLIIQRAMQEGSIGGQAQANTVSANPGGDSLDDLQASKCVSSSGLAADDKGECLCTMTVTTSRGTFTPHADSAESIINTDAYRALSTRRH